LTAVSAVVALGLGIGFTTLTFSLIYGALYRPLPVPGGDRVIHLEQANPSADLYEEGLGVHDYLDWGARQRTLQGLGAFARGTVNLSGTERPERYFGAFVTANTFDLLRVRPVLGRAFLPAEQGPDAPAVAMISHTVWHDRFGARPDVIGETVRVNGEPTTVVGVLPEGFAFPYWEDVWLPLRVDRDSYERGEVRNLEVFGRLGTTTTLDDARADFRAIDQSLERAYPETNAGWRTVVEEYAESYRSPSLRPSAYALLLAVFAMLLVACFNVANLLLAKAVVRTRELAIRTALGASRRRVAGLLLAEALLYAMSGALMGTILALGGLWLIDRALLAAATYPPPFWIVFRLDAPILLFIVSLAVVSALAAGLLPAVRFSRVDVQACLAGGTGTTVPPGIGGFSRFLVITELAVSVLLLTVAGHAVLDVRGARTSEWGFRTDDVLTARIGLFEGDFPDAEHRRVFFTELLEGLHRTPGVHRAALTTTLPGLEAGFARVAVTSSPLGTVSGFRVRTAAVSSGFFETIGVRPIQGRGFSRSDDPDGLPVAIVNRSFARRYFQGADPIGRQVLVLSGGGGVSRTVVGVVPDLNLDGALEPEGDPEGFYVPLGQGDATFVSVAVRTLDDPLSLAPAVRALVMDLQEDTPIYFVRTLRDAVNTGLLDLVLFGTLFVVFSAVAFLLAAVGLYGVMSFLASRRSKELGLRMALGASVATVLRGILRQGSVQVLWGLALGLGSAVLLRMGFQSLGVDVAPWSVSIMAVVLLGLGATGLAAVLMPALKAVRVDPLSVLKHD
jgi:predicted permease